jgi:hypothetical protein
MLGGEERTLGVLRVILKAVGVCRTKRPETGPIWSASGVTIKSLLGFWPQMTGIESGSKILLMYQEA